MQEQNIILDLLSTLKQKALLLQTNTGLLKTSIAGFNNARHNNPVELKSCIYKPLVILVLQGTKYTILGNKEFFYTKGQYFLTSVDTPALSSVTKATPDCPFLSLILELDIHTLNNLLVDLKTSPIEKQQQGCGIDNISEALLNAFFRLINTLNNPLEEKIIAPLIIKEIHFLLLNGSLSHILKATNIQNSINNRIMQSISWLLKNYKQNIKVKDLASIVNMGESSFYRHFNSLVGLSPLQYQKKLRLYEAQRLIISEKHTVANACYQVSYNSPSQFNREYKKIFAKTPKALIIR